MTKTRVRFIEVGAGNPYHSTLNALASEGKLSPVQFVFRSVLYQANCLIHALTWLRDQGYYESNDPIVEFVYV
jgi:hypothetical protein